MIKNVKCDVEKNRETHDIWRHIRVVIITSETLQFKVMKLPYSLNELTVTIILRKDNFIVYLLLMCII